ncbi:MAG TPA: glycosyltransferase family 2 protein [Polyangiaceae bacterium]|jgi:glycosyltransferase involved in cell wall biosynthesis|nr:glycosyltransferase family 2 protein [Polyangiaceae bacterium]
MKLLIQIPCHNEEQSLPVSYAALPKSIPGVDSVEVLIINDGSTDRTVEVARQLGVHHVVGFARNQGLARAFMLGIRSCLERGADIIVNTDADNQYNADDIPALIQPILDGRAEIVVGARPIATIEHFSPVKKLLQKLGSGVVKRVSGTTVVDAPSGFRAFSREAAARLNVFSAYTYTLETIIQAGQKNMSIVSVPVRVNGDLRPSRLVRSIPSYIRRSVGTMLRIFIIYRPSLFFTTLGGTLFLAGLGLAGRFLYFYLRGDHPSGHLQSLLLAAVMMILGFQTGLLAIITDLLSVNRRLLEELLEAKRAPRKRDDA